MAPLTLLLCVFLSRATLTHGQTRINVTTRLGLIIGTEETHVLPDGTQTVLRMFRGVPYALPPVGQFRFQKPRPVLAYSDPLEALQFGPACPQRRAIGNMSEDCLFLNVFTPKPSSENISFPVIVWIHGGAYVTGEGRRLPAESLASYGNIIVVTLNFRLGALGFLSTQDQQAPGNWGLWDQRLALQWVRENIVHFHGDPEKMTLAGTTSGAFCVNYHVLYPPNDGLFQRIIVESGAAVSSLDYHSSSLKYAEALARGLGCSIGHSARHASKAIIACLREIDAETITASANAMAGPPFKLMWIPVVDGEFLVEDPSAIMSLPTTERVPDNLGALDALVGTTSSDGSVVFSIWVRAMASAMNESVASGVSSELFEKAVEVFVRSSQRGADTTEDAWMVSQAVLQEYRNWGAAGNESQSRGRELVDMFTDKGFFVPNVIFTRNHADRSNGSSKTFMYEFHQRSPAPDPNSWMVGSLHKDQDLYVFGLAPDLLSGASVDLATEQGASEWRFSQRVMTYWSNFVKTGNPNTPEPVPVEWPPFTLADEEYLHLEAERIAARRHCRARRASFWLSFLPKMQTYARTQRANCTRDGDASSDAQSVLRHSVDLCCMGLAVVVMLFVKEVLPGDARLL